jgi:hypothetical protein
MLQTARAVLKGFASQLTKAICITPYTACGSVALFLARGVSFAVPWS